MELYGLCLYSLLWKKRDGKPNHSESGRPAGVITLQMRERYSEVLGVETAPFIQSVVGNGGLSYSAVLSGDAQSYRETSEHVRTC